MDSSQKAQTFRFEGTFLDADLILLIKKILHFEQCSYLKITIDFWGKRNKL